MWFYSKWRENGVYCAASATAPLPAGGLEARAASSAAALSSSAHAALDASAAAAASSGSGGSVGGSGSGKWRSWRSATTHGRLLLASASTSPPSPPLPAYLPNPAARRPFVLKPVRTLFIESPIPFVICQVVIC